METGLNIRDHLFTKLPLPSYDFSGQTVIVTGASSGIGFETAQHLVQLNAEHVVLAVRSLEKGNDARNSIFDANPKSTSKISVWQLDLSSYASVKAFASRVYEEIPQLHCVINNASIAVLEYHTVEDNESTLTVNVISTMLLTLLLIPVLRRTRERGKSSAPVLQLTIVTSASHVTTTIPTANIFATLNDPKAANMMLRYGTSKLMQLFLFKSLAERISASDIIINCVDPGAAKTNILSKVDHGFARFFSVLEQYLLGRSAEHASRGVVWAIERRPETHGNYVAHCKIYRPSRFVTSTKGKKAQDRLWKETMEKIHEIDPKLCNYAGLLESGQNEDMMGSPNGKPTKLSN